MGMPVTVKIADSNVTEEVFNDVFNYFYYVDAKFSTYKNDSEISKINRGEIAEEDRSEDMRTVFKLSEITKQESNGYFDIKRPDGTYDPSGTVKGWAIFNAADIIRKKGFNDFFVDAGGDIQVSGFNFEGNNWRVGIKNPFDQKEIVKAVELKDGCGIATSGTYIRGQHIYDPKDGKSLTEVVSLTVIGPDVYEADRFATAAFAMGLAGINFIEKLPGLEGYSIDAKGVATMTSGFEKYINGNN